MRTSYRALSVEAVEDRSLPSSFFFIEPTFGYASHGRDAGSDLAAGYAPRAGVAFDEIIFRNQSGNPTFVLINYGGFGGEGAGGFELIPIFVGTGYGQTGTPTPTPIPQPTGTGSDGGTSSNGGSAGQSGGDFGPTPVAPAHMAAQAQANTPAAIGPGNVAALLPSQTATNVAPATAQQTANAAQVAAAANGQPATTLVSTPITTTHAGYAITATTPDADAPSPDDAIPPPPSMPLAPTPAPDISAVGTGIVAVATAVVTPVAGVVPFDVSTLSTGASQFLGRVSDLAPTWPDSMPAITDSLWVAAAALLTGGALHAASIRSAPRSQDTFGRANALSEWERRNGRVTG